MLKNVPPTGEASTQYRRSLTLVIELVPTTSNLSRPWLTGLLSTLKLVADPKLVPGRLWSILVSATAVKVTVTAKLPELVAVPPGATTDICPVIAPAGTVAVICVFEATVNAAALVVPNLTAVAPVKPEPPIVTTVPAGPEAGENPLIEGGGITVKLPVLVAVPPGVVTDIGAVIAPAGTVAVICVFETTVNAAAFVVPNLTAVVQSKPVPLIVTTVPTGPEAGEKPVIVGGGITVKLPELVAVPPGVMTDICPELAPAGTVALICSSEMTVSPVRFVPFSVTAVAHVRPVPPIVTSVPTGPEAGENPLIEGGGITVKLPELVPVPPGASTEICPELAPSGTVAVICSSETTV